MGTRAFVKVLLRRAAAEADWLWSRWGRSDVAVFHEFHAPPYGGGNQFLLALVRELRERGVSVEANRLSAGTPACLFNSFNFAFSRLHRFARSGVRMVHRVDGPIGVYRGFDDGSDRRIVAVNQELADATIVQSRFSLDKHAEQFVDLAPCGLAGIIGLDQLFRRLNARRLRSFCNDCRSRVHWRTGNRPRF